MSVMQIQNLDGMFMDVSTDPPTLVGYLFDFTGHGVYSPDGKLGELPGGQVDQHNRLLSQAELAGMVQHGRGTMYLFRTDGKVTHVGTWASQLDERARTVQVRKSWHNFAGRDGRTDVWFYLDGSEWHGVNIGDSDIVRVKRLKRKH